MAIIPLLRTITFILISLVSLVLLVICAYLQYLFTKYTDLSPPFLPLGIGAGCLTVISLPLFLVLDHFRRHVFTSMILFELIWFAVLCVLWAGTASDTAVIRSYYFPTGCIYYNFPPENRVCYEFTTVEVLAFFNFLSAFVYFIVLLFYAILHINVLRGRSVWTSSVKEVAIGISSTQGVSMLEGRFNPMPATQYSPNFPPFQVYNGYSQQVPLQGPPVQSYNTYPYPQQVLLQAQQFDAGLQQASPNRFSVVSQGNQSNSRPSSSRGPQQQLQVHYPSYPSGINPQDISSPPLPNSSGHPGPLAVPQQQY